MGKKEVGSNLIARRRKGEDGSVLAMAAMSMLAMILAGGLAIDISHLYSAKAELQSAADAAAIAGASQLSSTSGGILSAANEATKALNQYDFGKSITISNANVTFATNLNGPYVDLATASVSPTTVRFVQVTIPPQPVTMSLTNLVINGTQNLTATATAGLSVGLTMNKFYTAYTFIELPATPFVPGLDYTLDAKAWNDSSPNSYRVLSYSGGDLVLTGSIHAYGYIGNSYTISSPTTSAGMCHDAVVGMNTRFGDYTVHPQANPIDEPPDTIIDQNITYATYRTMQGNGVVEMANGVKNRRIFQAPIADNTTYNNNGSGPATVTAKTLAGFFLRRKVGADCKLEVEYIGAGMAVPDGTYQPGLTQMPGLSIPVLYK